MQNVTLDQQITRRYVAIAGSSCEIHMINLEKFNIDNSLMINDKPTCLEWVGTTGALICGDEKGFVHLFMWN